MLKVKENHGYHVHANPQLFFICSLRTLVITEFSSQNYSMNINQQNSFNQICKFNYRSEVLAKVDCDPSFASKKQLFLRV